MKEKQDILMVGVGGQGIVLASDILGEVAIAAGYDVKKTDTLGMAQRGGSVVSNIRIANHVWSPMIKEGEVDMLVAFEKLEAARWLSYLKPNGVAIINDQAISPLSVSSGINRYPSNKEIEDIVRQRTDKIFFIDGASKVKALGDIRTLNIFMLGCISLLLPIDSQVWQDCIAKTLPPKILDINIKAFNLGKKESPHVNV